jgi:aromatic ring-opening dioxygenase LigB subunit
MAGSPLKGAIVPHAPVLLLPSSDDAVAQAQTSIVKSMTELDWSDVDAIVVVSPHGPRSGIYLSTGGSLDGFGVRGVAFSGHSHTEIAACLAQLSGAELLEGPADHGIVVPLLLAQLDDVPVVAVTLGEITGAHGTSPARAIDGARALASAVHAVAEEWSIAFIASAHSAASLSPRAPLAERPAGAELDRLILHALEDDVAGLAHIDPVLWSDAGSCGAGPLTAFGEVFAGRASPVAAYCVPAGVGYMVAEVSNGARR